MLILHCAECNNPLNLTTHRGSYCLNCEFTPSMQDTYFKEIVTKKEAANKIVEELSKRRGWNSQNGPTLK